MAYALTFLMSFALVERIDKLELKFDSITESLRFPPIYKITSYAFCKYYIKFSS
jgi:hypothetical protein